MKAPGIVFRIKLAGEISAKGIIRRCYLARGSLLPATGSRTADLWNSMGYAELRDSPSRYLHGGFVRSMSDAWCISRAKTLGRATLSSRLMSRRRQSWSTRINGSPVLPCSPFCDGDTFALSCSRDNHIAGAFSMLLMSAREKKHA